MIISRILNKIEEKLPTNIYDYSKESMILRDFLALDRTIMANERTFLAWLRTALSLIAGGIAMVKLDNSLVFQVVGYLLIAHGIPIGIVGLIRYLRMNKRLEQIKF